MKILAKLQSLNACDESLAWASSLPVDITPQQAWDQCSEPKWLMWALAQPRNPTELLIGAVMCAIDARHYQAIKHVEDCLYKTLSVDGVEPDGLSLSVSRSNIARRSCAGIIHKHFPTCPLALTPNA